MSSENEKTIGKSIWKFVAGVAVILGALGAFSEMTGNPIFSFQSDDCIMPELKGVSEPIARIELKEICKAPIIKYIYNTDQIPGTILKQHPPFERFIKGCKTDVYLEIAAAENSSLPYKMENPTNNEKTNSNLWLWVGIIGVVILFFYFFSDWF